MPEAKKGVARIPVPPRSHPKPEVSIGADAKVADESLDGSAGSAETMMSAGAEGKRDPWTVPLIGLLLAFSVISLILQMLIALS